MPPASSPGRSCTDIVYENIDIESLDHHRGNQNWLLIHTRERVKEPTVLYRA
ncbi:hypothetical protein [Kribbella qitaiheensis]|uniref:hypothetical protein n=1 Tax=Kribbella qitaiheensis TaxID=1544730 RepID=UPI0036D3CB94